LLSKKKYEKYFNAFLILIVISYAIGTFTRLPVWKNSESLWLDAIKKAPTAHRSYYNLAGYYYDRQEYNKSIPLLEKYLELKPGDFIGYSKLRQTYFMIGNYEKTIEICRRMIDLDPKSQNRYYDLGIFFEKINMIDSAINFYRDALMHNPGFYKIRDHLGTLFLKKDFPDSAEKYFKSAIEINHEYTPSYFNLGTLYYMQGRDSMALSIIREGMAYGDAPENIRIILNKLQRANQ
jgi:tetratricopeptide (TPR) repeat protein